MGSTYSKPKKGNIKKFVNWFEIPALDMNRAMKFYNYIYQMDMEMVELNGYSMAFFNADRTTGGALVMGQGSIPSEVGPLIYLNGGKDLKSILDRIEEAGGRVILEKTLINKESGYFALFIDSEGNKLALHSDN
jgi:uncharacterized protein